MSGGRAAWAAEPSREREFALQRSFTATVGPRVITARTFIGLSGLAGAGE